MSQASLDLACWAQMLLRQSGLTVPGLTRFPESDWPDFCPPSPSTTDALKRKYGLCSGTPLPKKEAARMFVEVKISAIKMLNSERVMLTERRTLEPATGVLPVWIAGGYIQSAGEVAMVVEKWENVPEREDELWPWLDGTADLKRRVDEVIRYAGVQVDGDGGHNRHESCTRRRVGSRLLESTLT